MENKPPYGESKPEIDFVNLSPEEKHLANECLNDLRDYLDVTSDQEDRFNRFFDLFNKLCLDRAKSMFFPILFLLTVSCNSQINNEYKVKVIGVKDGDSIEVLDKERNLNFIVRLAEVDCPEFGQPFGKAAKKFTSDFIFGKTVSLEITDTDRYGRYVGKIYYQNKYLSAELVKSGLAWVYRKYSDNDELIELEENAKINKIGLWIDPKPVAPWEWRKK